MTSETVPAAHSCDSPSNDGLRASGQADHHYGCWTPARLVRRWA